VNERIEDVFSEVENKFWTSPREYLRAMERENLPPLGLRYDLYISWPAPNLFQDNATEEHSDEQLVVGDVGIDGEGSLPRVSVGVAPLLRHLIDLIAYGADYFVGK